MQAGKTTLIIMALMTFAACRQPVDNATEAAAQASGASERLYQAPPELTGASFLQDQRIELSGAAAPGAAVRLSSPGAAPQFATADAHGVWRLTAPASSQPRLFGLSMSDGGRIVQAMGYLFVAPGTVARLRVGGGTEVLAPTGYYTLAALALDYDNKGAATVSGFAGQGANVGLRADGVERGQATADPAGRFTLALSQPLTPGSHTFELIAPSGAVRFSANLAAPSPPAGAPYAATRQDDAWRVDWITPGGGEQTTLIFPGAGAPP